MGRINLTYPLPLGAGLGTLFAETTFVVLRLPNDLWAWILGGVLTTLGLVLYRKEKRDSERVRDE